MASRVELRAWICVCGVQRDNLMAHKVVAWLDARGNCVFDSGPGFHGGSVAPDVGGADAAFFFDLSQQVRNLHTEVTHRLAEPTLNQTAADPGM
jgi:hypothetical protein